MGNRGSTRVLFLIVAVVVVVSVQGCRLFTANPTPPPSPLVPTIVGVVNDLELTPTATIFKLADGRTVAQVYADKDVVLHNSYAPGRLILARASEPKFIGFLRPMGEDYPGCWDADGEGQFVWDEGDSLLFSERLELPKAPGFHDDAISEVMDGRKVWSKEANRGVWKICANVSGQIEWISSPYRQSGQ